MTTLTTVIVFEKTELRWHDIKNPHQGASWNSEMCLSNLKNTRFFFVPPENFGKSDPVHNFIFEF